MQLGFIGLGTMGRPLALHLIDAGYSLSIFARREETAKPLVEAGAVACPTPAAVAEQSDVIFTMVTATADVQQVVLGKDGIIHGARKGTLLIDLTSIDPSVTRDISKALADVGVDMLDAPVTGGPQGAKDASLTIMVGGPQKAFERAQPLFKVLGHTSVHMGETGSGQTTKACNQIAIVVTAQAVAEALTLARNTGLDPEQVRQVLMGGIASSQVMELFGSHMTSREFSAGCESRLYHKDIDVALQIGHSCGTALPATALTMQFINAMMGAHREHQDFSALITVIEQLATAPDSQ